MEEDILRKPIERPILWFSCFPTVASKRIRKLCLDFFLFNLGFIGYEQQILQFCQKKVFKNTSYTDRNFKIWFWSIGFLLQLFRIRFFWQMIAKLMYAGRTKREQVFKIFKHSLPLFSINQLKVFVTFVPKLYYQIKSQIKRSKFIQEHLFSTILTQNCTFHAEKMS